MRSLFPPLPPFEPCYSSSRKAVPLLETWPSRPPPPSIYFSSSPVVVFPFPFFSSLLFSRHPFGASLAFLGDHNASNRALKSHRKGHAFPPFRRSPSADFAFFSELVRVAFLPGCGKIFSSFGSSNSRNPSPVPPACWTWGCPFPHGEARYTGFPSPSPLPLNLGFKDTFSDTAWLRGSSYTGALSRRRRILASLNRQGVPFQRFSCATLART